MENPTRGENRFFLKPSRLHQGEARIRYWYAIIEEGTPYEAVFKPEFWASHKHQFEIGDFIRCEPDEGHYTADLRVMSVGLGGVKVEEFVKKDWKVADAPLSLMTDYKVKFAGPHHKWRVERKTDKHIEATGFQNEAEANRWLATNAKKLQQEAAAT